MASASSMNSTSGTNGAISHHHNHHHAPNPPPRTHSRPNQPPPPPPLPSVPPVPPTRDSSIAISKAAIGNVKHYETSTIPPPPPPTSYPTFTPKLSMPNLAATKDSSETFLSPFLALFKTIADLPPPEPFTNKSKTYPSQKAQQKQSSSS